MVMAGPVQPGVMAPIAKVGECIAIQDNSGYRVYRIGYIIPYPRGSGLIMDISNTGNGSAGIPAFASGQPGLGPAWGGATQQNDNLNLPAGVLGQFRPSPLSDFGILVSEPGPNNALYTLANVQSEISPFDVIDDLAGGKREIFVFESNSPVLTARNVRAYTHSDALVEFPGYKYVLSGASGYAAGQGNSLAPLGGPFATLNDLLDARNGWASLIMAVVVVGSIGK